MADKQLYSDVINALTSSAGDEGRLRKELLRILGAAPEQKPAFQAPPKPVPDFFEKILAWRAWNVTSYNGELTLQSFASSTYWLPGKPVAARCEVYGRENSTACPQCGFITHHAPVAGCRCGWYSFKTMLGLLEQIPAPRAQFQSTVYGAVKIWGKVIEHKIGYRSEFMEPVLLCTWNDGLCKRYGCEQFKGTPHELLRRLAQESNNSTPL